MKTNSKPRVTDQIQDLTNRISKDAVQKIYSDVVFDMVKGTSLAKHLKTKKSIGSLPPVVPQNDSK